MLSRLGSLKAGSRGLGTCPGDGESVRSSAWWTAGQLLRAVAEKLDYPGVWSGRRAPAQARGALQILSLSKLHGAGCLHPDGNGRAQDRILSRDGQCFPCAILSCVSVLRVTERPSGSTQCTKKSSTQKVMESSKPLLENLNPYAESTASTL